jgi:hypothetical protein
MVDGQHGGGTDGGIGKYRSNVCACRSTNAASAGSGDSDAPALPQPANPHAAMLARIKIHTRFTNMIECSFRDRMG